MAQLLNNIVKVEWILSPRHMRNLVLPDDHRVLLRYYRPFHALCLDGLAQVEVSEAVEDGSRLTTVRLTAHTTEDFHVDNRRLCWRVTTVDGRQYLIGLDEQPWPVATVADAYPDKATDRSGKTLTVTWTTPLGLLRIIDNAN